MARRKAPESMVQRVGRGRRDGLEALRDKLAADLEAAEPSVSAQIAGQLRQVLRELDELPVAGGKSARERFADRVAAANADASSA